MYSSTFTFAKGQFDADFHALDEAIAQAARAIPGYLGEEAWVNSATGLVSNVYYWETREALQQLMQLPLHREAKQAQSRWLDGYHVVVARVLGSHGNARIAHPLARRDLPLQWDDDAA